MPRVSPLCAVLFTVLLFAAACGSDDITDVATAVDGAAQTQLDDSSTGDSSVGEPIPADEPGEDLGEDSDRIPVEPDGGIGDGAEPLPGAEDPEETGTWHGAEVAETNCPGVEWQRVEASAFTFSVPTTFANDQVQGIDSEVGQWSNGAGIEVSYDYGWYSYSIAEAAGAEVEEVDYSGVLGQFAVVRAADTNAETNSVGVYFPEVNFANEVWDKLGLIVTHEDPNDEIIGRCIARSVEFG